MRESAQRSARDTSASSQERHPNFTVSAVNRAGRPLSEPPMGFKRRRPAPGSAESTRSRPLSLGSLGGGASCDASPGAFGYSPFRLLQRARQARTVVGTSEAQAAAGARDSDADFMPQIDPPRLAPKPSSAASQGSAEASSSGTADTAATPLGTVTHPEAPWFDPPSAGSTSVAAGVQHSSDSRAEYSGSAPDVTSTFFQSPVQQQQQQQRHLTCAKLVAPQIADAAAVSTAAAAPTSIAASADMLQPPLPEPAAHSATATGIAHMPSEPLRSPADTAHSSPMPATGVASSAVPQQRSPPRRGRARLSRFSPSKAKLQSFLPKSSFWSGGAVSAGAAGKSGDRRAHIAARGSHQPASTMPIAKQQHSASKARQSSIIVGSQTGRLPNPVEPETESEDAETAAVSSNTAALAGFSAPPAVAGAASEPTGSPVSSRTALAAAHRTAFNTARTGHSAPVLRRFWPALADSNERAAQGGNVLDQTPSAAVRQHSASSGVRDRVWRGSAALAALPQSGSAVMQSAGAASAHPAASGDGGLAADVPGSPTPMLLAINSPRPAPRAAGSAASADDVARAACHAPPSLQPPVDSPSPAAQSPSDSGAHSVHQMSLTPVPMDSGTTSHQTRCWPITTPRIRGDCFERSTCSHGVHRGAAAAANAAATVAGRFGAGSAVAAA